VIPELVSLDAHPAFKVTATQESHITIGKFKCKVDTGREKLATLPKLEGVLARVLKDIRDRLALSIREKSALENLAEEMPDNPFVRLNTACMTNPGVRILDVLREVDENRSTPTWPSPTSPTRCARCTARSVGTSRQLCTGS
jgi:hypothetical protein